MKRHILLKKTINMARTGDAESFENFYILTVQNTYGKICVLTKDREMAEQILTEVYVSLYQKVHTLPPDEMELQARMEEEIYRAAEKYLDSEPEKTDIESVCEKLSEDQAATLWMDIEESAGIDKDDAEEERWSSFVFVFLRIAAAAAAVIITGIGLFVTWRYTVGRADSFSHPAQESSVVQESSTMSEEELIISGEREEPGWSLTREGKLRYVRKDGTLAEGSVAIGKQMMTFSGSGELTLIGSNPVVAENADVSFDEDVKYEVRDGNVYRTDPESGEESCVILNGHVSQADVRCGYIWYICMYQIPNSDQIRTTVNRALPDGSGNTEVYVTANTLETQSFQVTDEGIYYLSEGKLFRLNFSSNRTEYLAGQVEYYFAWDDTAYYMQDRTLESVSRGYSYSGMEAGFQIETEEAGFVLLNSEGELPVESGNGEVQVGDRIYRLEEGYIASVRPAERKKGEYSYFIDESGTDHKIYRTDSAGTRGLIPQEGISADSLCIAGEWLYYSARTAQYGAECESQIYRVNLETMELEAVGEKFRGQMRNLYYFESMQEIYGEYIPSVADPEDIHGKIARITENGTEIINDLSVRPENDSSDMLEPVMAGENTLLCLYHTCSYDMSSGQLAWKSTQPLVIELPR